ncbi:Mu-like prophage major head subunit gpT family protein [Nitrosovibrio sp. Nv4]|uniref:Mu-like prophage major head subunit gpT family protein n=1 Tax=Nitrosovibrio sp. Nv4 TaxID=1945880 RepID=UPI000BD37954|nr:Mu-like prophage major head subunit gpT family protein [Nitrosovibrio sp. Nv4]SOD42324.1 Mu-like prophage major head subunit gpT [Nitrosovibrio sp. Nv4]
MNPSKILVLACAGLLAMALIPFGAMAALPLPMPDTDVEVIGLLGLLVNKATISNVFISLKTTFNNAFGAAPTVWQKIAMKVTSTTGQNDYAWLSKFPKMRKWIGDKAVKSLEAFKYTVVNDDFEATVEVDRNDIEDDNLGIYGPQAQMAGESAAQLPDEIVMDLVNNGFTNLCFDGQYFFDTDHVVAGASVSNKGTKALSIATLALAQASYGAYRTAMKKFKDDEGRPLNVNPNILLVGPSLEDTANALMTVDRLEDGKPNPYKGTATVVVDARITSDTAWYLLDTTKAVKPFIYQERKAPVFVEQTASESDDVFNRKKFKFGAEARAAGGYGFWQLAYGSDGTT